MARYSGGLTRSLSIHAGYRCQHRGACCTSGWPIPVEVDRLARIRAAIASGAVRTASPQYDVFIESAEAPAESPVLLATIDDRCVFYDADAKRCGIQRALDHGALPLACRQFPRVSVRDPRGTSVTLSHYCPTAASMLDSPEVVTIVENAPAFPPGGEYVGLDATSSLPPLLRPDMLMDWESWWEWERLSVELLTADASPAVSVGRLSVAVELARSWKPADGSLMERVREAFDRAARVDVRPAVWSDDELSARRDEVLDAIPPGLAPPADTRRPSATSPVVLSRLLAAHAFANWTAHLGRGLRTWLRSVEAPLALVQLGLDVRTADLWLRHLVEPKRAAENWSQIEIGH